MISFSTDGNNKHFFQLPLYLVTDGADAGGLVGAELQDGHLPVRALGAEDPPAVPA